MGTRWSKGSRKLEKVHLSIWHGIFPILKWSQSYFRMECFYSNINGICSVSNAPWVNSIGGGVFWNSVILLVILWICFYAAIHITDTHIPFMTQHYIREKRRNMQSNTRVRTKKCVWQKEFSFVNSISKVLKSIR